MPNLDPFVSCPYNFEHRVPRSRLQAHIVKCQRNYNKLQICPYNALHRFHEVDIKEHCANCPDKEAMYPEPGPRTRLEPTGKIMKPKPIMQTDYLPETDPHHECWDD